MTRERYLKMKKELAKMAEELEAEREKQQAGNFTCEFIACAMYSIANLQVALGRLAKLSEHSFYE